MSLASAALAHALNLDHFPGSSRLYTSKNSCISLRRCGWMSLISWYPSKRGSLIGTPRIFSSSPASSSMIRAATGLTFMRHPTSDGS